jgi:hypothetical protein
MIAMVTVGHCLAVNSVFGYFPSTNPDLMVIHVVTPNGSNFFSEPFRIGTLQHTVQVFVAGLSKTPFNVVAHKDPSLAYNFQFVNSDSEPQPFHVFIDFPIRPLGANTTFAELNVELIDMDGNGQASLIGQYDPNGAIQAVRTYNSITRSGELIGPPLGENMTSPGMKTFVLEPFPGPTLANGDMLGQTIRFTLSPGDAARLTSRFIIDEATGIPFAEIPELPNPADGPYFNVIDISSPETSFGDNYFVGSQTQLNLSEGGSIGERFNFHTFMNNELNDNNFDVEVNITGGTVGNQFMALGGTTVNISGGTIEGPTFLAGSFTGESTDVEVNMSGGTMRAQLQAYAGSVTNISGGVVNSVSANDGVVYLSGGTIGQQSSGNSLQTTGSGVFHISGGSFGATGQISLLNEGVANISGGSFTTAAHSIQARQDATINLFGTEFNLNGVEIAGLDWGVPFTISQRDVTLSGLLSDGSPFSIDLNSVDPSPAQGDWIHPDATLTVTLALPGDFNNNGTVDAADYALWRNTLDSDSTLPNDTSPGAVTQHDYQTWRASFGKTRTVNGSAAGDGGVPEPAPLLLLFAAMAGGSLFRHRCREMDDWKWRIIDRFIRIFYCNLSGRSINSRCLTRSVPSSVRS